MGYERILVPLDGSVIAEMALEHVPKCASAGAQIHLLTIITTEISEMAGMPLTYWPLDITEDVKAQEGYLKKVAASLEQQGYQVIIDVRRGSVAEMIAEVANTGFELVVIATHHRRGLNKFLFGSVAERLIQQTHCPIVIV